MHHLSLAEGAALVAFGFAVGAFGTMVGAGGGFIITPALFLLYPHDPPATLTAISLTAVFFNAGSGSIAYARQRRIDYRSGILFGLATLPGSIAGALLVSHVGKRPFTLVLGLVLAGGAVWLGLVGRQGDTERQGSPRELTDSTGTTHRYRVPVARGIGYSAAVGFASTFLGIGGGVLHVPLLVRSLGFPTHVATATSHFVLAIMAGSASLVHLLTGGLTVGHGLRRALLLSAGIVVGAQLGARASVRLRGRTIELLLAGALAALAVRLLVSLA